MEAMLVYYVYLSTFLFKGGGEVVRGSCGTLLNSWAIALYWTLYFDMVHLVVESPTKKASYQSVGAPRCYGKRLLTTTDHP